MFKRRVGEDSREVYASSLWWMEKNLILICTLVEFNMFTEMPKSIDPSLPLMSLCFVNQLKTSGQGCDVAYDGCLLLNIGYTGVLSHDFILLLEKITN